MPIVVLTDASVVISGTNLSDHIRKVTVQMNVDDVDISAMGGTSHVHAPGLRDDRITMDIYTDYDASKTDAVISALLGVAAGGTIVVKPTSATVSATNPTYTMIGFPVSYSPIDGEVGAASLTTVEFVPALGGKIVRATA